MNVGRLSFRRVAILLVCGVGPILGLLVPIGGGPVQAADTGSGTSRQPALPSRLSFDDTLALALAYNPSIADSGLQIETARGRLVQAGKSPNPALDLRFSQLGERGGVEDVARRRIFLRQDFELGGKRGHRIALARIEGRLADWNERSSRSRVAALAKIRFAEMLGAQRRVMHHQETVDYVEKLNTAAERMVANGALRSVEMSRIVRRLGQTRIDLSRAEAELGAARYGLAGLWGSTSPTFDRVVGELEPPGPIPGIEIVFELGAQSPSAELREAELARRRAELALARSSGVPDLNFGVGIAWEQGGTPPDYSLDFEIDLPLFDRNQGNVRAAKSELARIEFLHDAAAVEDAQLIADLYAALSESAARSAILGEELLPAARAAVIAVRQGFERQAEDLSDLLDSRGDLIQTQIDYTDALVDYRRTLAQLELIVGQALDAPP